MAALCNRSVVLLRYYIVNFSKKTGLFSTYNSSLVDKRESKFNKFKKKTYKHPPWSVEQSWEENLADVVTPLWRLSYEEQLEVKQKQQLKILSQLSWYLIGDSQSQTSSSVKHKPSFTVLPILPSPVQNGYRNKSTFNVNKGVDGNEKTVGFYLGTGGRNNIVCVNGDHLLNMPENHKLVARCYQDFIRRSPLKPCLLFHTGGHWREITVRTNHKDHTMAIVYFHPQTLTPEEVSIHKADLQEYFIHGPGSVCQLDSLFFQESVMTRCTHEQSPYQLLHGQPHMYEEVI